MISVPGLNLQLRLNYVSEMLPASPPPTLTDTKSSTDSHGSDSHGSDSHGSTEKMANFNYEVQGDDWPKKFYFCGQPQQSPINLLTPVSKYGTQYNIYSPLVDNPKRDYKDMFETFIKFNPLFYSFEIKIDHSQGYSGFRTKLGKALFSSKDQWDGYEIIFHSPSEHTIDGRRYDLEMQIIHKPFLT
jgi:hypothetical protein